MDVHATVYTPSVRVYKKNAAVMASINISITLLDMNMFILLHY